MISMMPASYFFGGGVLCLWGGGERGGHSVGRIRRLGTHFRAVRHRLGRPVASATVLRSKVPKPRPVHILCASSLADPDPSWPNAQKGMQGADHTGSLWYSECRHGPCQHSRSGTKAHACIYPGTPQGGSLIKKGGTQGASTRYRPF